MIRINKGAAPVRLITANNRLRAANERAYDRNPRGYQSGTPAFTFTSAYKSKQVKLALYNAQHNKCAFTEAKFVADDFHVEHFRPKGRVDSWPGGDSTYPGYFWLAYEWNNLLLCKSNTNSSRKRNFFPLVGNTQRNLSHRGRRVENPVLIDPSIENPRTHIRFENGEIVGKTKRGKETIKILNLRNADLDEARRTKCKLLRTVMVGVEALLAAGTSKTNPIIQDMLTTLRQAKTPQAEFSSMATDLLAGWPHL